MSIYGDEFGGDLYTTPPPPQKPQEPAKATEPIDPGEAVGQTLQVIANPLKLAGDTLLQDPAESKLPLGLAILGACVAAIWLAAHFDKGGEK